MTGVQTCALPILKCKNCGYTFSKYKSTGLFGCDSCYDTFKSEIDNILLKIQGKNRHIQNTREIENTNNETQPKNELETLKEKLDILVKEEKFEEAAILRDKIKEIQKGGKE